MYTEQSSEPPLTWGILPDIKFLEPSDGFHRNLVSSSQQTSESEMAVITSSTHAETEAERFSHGFSFTQPESSCPGKLT